jgi:class 3 adenylate cyclase
MREERKVVTALFADVVGSTQLTERMDPEDAREVLGGAVRRMVDAVEAFGGTVKDLAGDGILALFGAPATHEDDAERAIRAALRIVERTDDDSVDVRVGIETGLVVLGPIGGGGRDDAGDVAVDLHDAARGPEPCRNRVRPGRGRSPIALSRRIPEGQKLAREPGPMGEALLCCAVCQARRECRSGETDRRKST